MTSYSFLSLLYSFLSFLLSVNRVYNLVGDVVFFFLSLFLSFFLLLIVCWRVCSLVGDVLFFFLSFLYSFLFSFFLFLIVWGEVCCLVGDLFCFSLVTLVLSFCSESTGPLDLNYSSLFFYQIANKQINFQLARFRELLITQLDHKSEFLHKNPRACISQKLSVFLLGHLK